MNDKICALPEGVPPNSSAVTKTRNAELAALISEASIRRLAGDTYYRRGHDYYCRGRVLFIEESGASVRSIVEGTESYPVLLMADGKVLDHDCRCPLGVDGQFCKHCVASALAWLYGQVQPVAGTGKKVHESEKEITEKDVAEALLTETKDALIKLLLDWSARDKALRERLILLAAGRKGGEVLHARVRRSLEQAIRIRGFVDYREMPGYADRINVALDAVESMLNSAEASGVIEICESGMRRLTDAIARTDDSDGYMSGLMERLQELHLRACQKVRPDPEALARRLFLLELKSEYGEWSDSAVRYAEVLGEKGLVIFRRLAETEWAGIPVKTGRYNGIESGNRAQITSIMESLAQQSGDVDQMVAVLERDLSSAYQYLHIVETYRRAGKDDQALAWAERGVEAIPVREGAALRLFMAQEYQRLERHADALRLIWINFRSEPRLESYCLLREFANIEKDWDDWRERALTYIRATLSGKKQGSQARQWWQSSQNHSLLVEIFLNEGRTEEAWQEAQAGDCRNDLWLCLAEARGKTYPEDAVSVYLRLAEQAIVNSQNSRYEAAVELLEKAAALFHSMGKSKEFACLLESLREKYKAKRNLQKLAEERRSFLYPQ